MANYALKNTIKAIYQYKITLLLLALWAHVSLLNLFYVSYAGPVFLWQENSQPLTLIVHLLIAVITTAFYLAVSKLRKINKVKKAKITDKIWLCCSLALMFSILFLIM